MEKGATEIWLPQKIIGLRITAPGNSRQKLFKPKQFKYTSY